VNKQAGPNLRSPSEENFDIEILRATRATAFQENNIQSMQRKHLLLLQKHFQLGNTWGEIQLPAAWRKSGSRRSMFRYDLYVGFSKHAKSKKDLELAVLTATRMFLLCLCAPSSVGLKEIFLNPRTLISNLKGCWSKIFKLALSRPEVGRGQILDRIGVQDFRPDSKEAQSMKTLLRFSSRNCWTDVPDWIDVEIQHEQSNLGDRDAHPKPPVSNKFLPLPDAFVHNTGQRVAWIIESLTRPLLDAFEKLITLRRNPSGRGRLNIDCSSRYCTKFLKSYNWSVESLPFDIQKLALYSPGFGNRKRTKSDVSWPPKNWSELLWFVRVVQTANYFVLALCAGPRVSEILSFTTWSLTNAPDGTALIDGKTWKLAAGIDGEERNWPMPEIAMLGAYQQRRLSTLVAMMMDDDLTWKEAIKQEFPFWRAISEKGMKSDSAIVDNTANHSLRWFCRAIGVDKWLDNQALTTHRFRKTLARLVAIAFVHSPQILLDIFGHKAIEMTLSYILSDPQIVADMREAREELVRIEAKDTIQNVDLLGGPAAKDIRQAVEVAKRRCMGDFGAKEEDELVEMLTYSGRTWTKPRESIICTKNPGDFGPCAVGTIINAANCQVSCSNRLELPTARSQAESAIKRCIEKVEEFQKKDDLMFAEIWKVKLMENISRFDDLRDKWLKHPIVADALAESK